MKQTKQLEVKKMTIALKNTGGVQNIGFNDDDQSVEELTYDCIDCGESFAEEIFEYVDDEINTEEPRCPNCQSQQRINSSQCEDCENPGAFECERGILCEDCYEHYVDGYVCD